MAVESRDIERVTLADIFGPDGYIARSKDGYEVRPQQVDVALMAERAINENRNALIEAGTGTGKSFALLAPAILSGKRTVVSTETNTLLDQYILKDLPFLAEVLPVRFTFAKAKGKTNFVCLKRVEEYLSSEPMLLLSSFADPKEVNQLVAWSRDTKTGDRSEPDFKFSDASWQCVCCDELCPRRQCEFYGEGAKGYSDCWAYKSRKAFLEADVVVTNHTLALINAQIGGDAVLGPHPVFIIDEAHTIGEQAQKTFGAEVRQRTYSSFMKYTLRLCRNAGMPIELDAGSLEYQEKGFFDKFEHLTKMQTTFVEMPESLIGDAKEFSIPIARELDGLRKQLNSQGSVCEEDKQLLDELDSRAFGHIKMLRGMFEPEANWLAFAEVQGNGDYAERKVTLHYKPVDVAPILQQSVYYWRQSTIMASATLAISGKFDFTVRDTGIPDPLTLRVDSPFNYSEQCVGYFPTKLSDPSRPEYHSDVAEEIEKILIHTRGRAFVLFTSYRDLERVHQLVSPRISYSIIKQGEYSKPVTIEKFKQDTHSVLFATRSFFTGVDVPGEALSCVILVKAPFRPPDEPLFAAKCKLIKERGGNDFIEYALPLMVNDLRQAFGRLIRARTDTGMFAFLDSRAINKPYFRSVIWSLPAIKVTTTL